MSTDSSAQVTLQLQQLQRNFKQSETDLDQARREVEEHRELIISLGQAFVPEAFAALVAGSDIAESAHRLKAMNTGEIVGLIVRAFGDKLNKLSAFTRGLTEEQKQRVIQRILVSDHSDWLNDPQFAEARREVERERDLRMAAEAKVRESDERVQRMETQQTETARELLHLRGEMKILQELITQRGSASVQSSAPASVAVPTRSIQPNPLTSPHDAVTRMPDSGTLAPTLKSPAEGMPGLILALATRGICERPRLSEILCREFGIGSAPDHLLVNAAFTNATEQGLVDVVKPRTETGVGRAPHLIRLTDAGKAYARQNLTVEPVPSELDRLLKLHDTPEHVLLILLARRLFLEKYLEPVENVDLFPAPIHLADGKRSEPDLSVTLKNGAVLLIECERDTPKHAAQRLDKWAKYWVASHGEFCVVCPDAKAVSAIGSEISLWHIQHGGKVHIRITSIYQAQTDPARFWVYDRTLG